MHIEVSCPLERGYISKHTFWSSAVAHGSVHEHQPVVIRAVYTREEWRRLPRDYKSGPNRRGGAMFALHRDSDGATIRVPVEVR